MTLQRELAERLVRRHPARAAAALEPLGAEAVAAWTRRLEPEQAGAVLPRLAPGMVGRVLALWPPARAAAMLASLDLDIAVRLLRRTDPTTRDALVAALPARRARAAHSLLRFPEESAGAWMDPEVLALPDDLPVREARRRLREEPELFRYNLYGVDREQRLTGVLTLRELWMARPGQKLADVMKRASHFLRAEDDRLRVASHPGWREVHALPVVDAAGVYLGAIRYRTLREVEGALHRERSGDARTADALAELFATGAAGLIEAVAGTAGRAGPSNGR